MKEIRALLTYDTIHSLEKHADIMYGGLITRSRNAGLTNKEILLICLVMLGFSNPEIALLTGATYSSVASRKSRLINRLVAEGIISPDDKRLIFSYPLSRI